MAWPLEKSCSWVNWQGVVGSKAQLKSIEWRVPVASVALKRVVGPGLDLQPRLGHTEAALLLGLLRDGTDEIRAGADPSHVAKDIVTSLNGDFRASEHVASDGHIPVLHAPRSAVARVLKNGLNDVKVLAHMRGARVHKWNPVQVLKAREQVQDLGSAEC